MFSEMMDATEFVSRFDSEVGTAMEQELRRQQRNLELIASKDMVSPAVLAAMGSILTNKHAEGYPGERYYDGCQYVDVVEEIARGHVCRLFGVEHANTQPHSDTQANLAVYSALLRPGDTVVGMNLAEGGYLTHGSPVNISGGYYHFVTCGVDAETHRTNYDELYEQAMRIKPKMIVAGASAYPRALDFKRFREIYSACGAYLMVNVAHIVGLVATELHASPVEWADVIITTTHKTLCDPRGDVILCQEKHARAIGKVIFPGAQGGPLMHIIAAKAVCSEGTLQPEFKRYQQQTIDSAQALADGLTKYDVKLVSGGTDNHLMLVDLSGEELTDKELEYRLDEMYITTNKNTAPSEQRSPFMTSGLRLDTPAVTTRDLNAQDMDEVVEYIAMAAQSFEDNQDVARAKIESICNRYPLYR